MQHSITRMTFILILPLVFISSNSLAVEPLHYNRIHLSAQAVADVKADVLVAILTVQREGKDTGKLAAEVNRLVKHALAICHKTGKIEVQTLGYQTSPIYDKGHRAGWRVSQSLQVKSQDPVMLGKLLGELQQDLFLTGMGYQVSPQTREQTENTLISKAITGFRTRAMIITHQLGHKRYRIVNMQINTSANAGIPLPIRRFKALAADRAEPAQIEAGKQSVTVTASGVIELE